MFSFKILSLTAVFSAVQSVHSFLDTDSSSNVAVYWGQNSGASGQMPLGYYCDNPNIDAFQLAFMTRIRGTGGVPEVDFANQGAGCSIFPGTGLLNCPQIGEDIKYCQTKGKTILLSIGGATYGEAGLPSADAAVSAAQVVWNAFGPVKTGSSTPRPFGDAVIDGFDLDFESPVSNMVPFANALRRFMDGGESRVLTSKRDVPKKHFLTAAPQCVFPDAANQEMLNGAVFFDAIWVQFYNNFCGLNSFIPGSGAQNAFNFDLWDGWAKSLSRNRNVKVFIGMPGSPGAAGSGFVAPNIMQQVLQWSKAFSSLGGIMVWDASQAYENRGMLDGLKQDLLH